jgi:type I restriction enzyme S subunit
MSWRKVKLGEFLIRSKIPVDIEDNKEYKRVKIRINHNGVSLRDVEQGIKIGTKKQFILKAGQFIVSKIDARYGAFGIAPDEVDGAIITGNFWAYDFDKTKINIDWLNQYTNSPEFYEICERASSGITHRKYLDEKTFLNHEVHLPDADEQKLVIKNAQELKTSFSFLSIELTHQQSLLTQLRQTFLREAMQGKLVEQNPKEGNATDLLKKIKAEKLKTGKKEKELLPIKEEEIPFAIPKNWEFCRLGEICVKIGSGSTPKGSNYSKDGIPFFRSQNVYDGSLVYDDINFISNEIHKQMNGTVVYANDILLNITGGSLGRTALVPNDFKEGNVSQHVCIIRPICIDINFLHNIILSPFFQKFIFSSTTGAGREGLPKYNLEQFLIPLPPLAEQKRIVKKLEEVMNLCEQLKTTITDNQNYTDQLLQVALKDALQMKEVEA